MVNWKVVYYHDQAVEDGHPMPMNKKQRETDRGLWLLYCDAECTACGYVQHPPKGGVCVCCGAEGDIDMSQVTFA